MSKKVSELDQARESKRDRTGWTPEEIRRKAAEDFKKYRAVSRENKEPDGFYSGDMKKFLQGRDDDNEEES
jgi:hypothetical protein